MSNLREIVRGTLHSTLGGVAFEDLVSDLFILKQTQKTLRQTYKLKHKESLTKIVEELQGNFERDNKKMECDITKNIGKIVLACMWEEQRKQEEDERVEIKK